VGDGKWETNGVKVNHPTPRLGFDAFESRSTLADPRKHFAYSNPYAVRLCKYRLHRWNIHASKDQQRWISASRLITI